MSKHLGRRALIRQKAERLTGSLSEWAKKDLLLGYGERLRITIEIISDEVPVDVVVKEGKGLIFDREPTEQDWENVFALPWATRRVADTVSKRGIPTENLLGMLRQMKEAENEYPGHRYDLTPLDSFLKRVTNKYRIRGYSLKVAR